jgi:RHS repeat-associated protein
MYCKRDFSFVLLFFVSINSIIGQQQHLSFQNHETGNIQHVSCKRIDLLPGYDYAANGQAMSCSIDPYIVCDLDYSSQQFGSTNQTSIDLNLPVGTTNGTFDVSPIGAAGYNIALFMPPGTLGFHPQISLNYNSQSGNGILGVGWNMSGNVLSGISRSPQNFYYDNAVRPISLDNDPNGYYGDRFVLDGTRLISNSGIYGQSGTIYRTESEQYLRITSYGNNASGPSHFVVETKDGNILEYGNTTDSYIEAASTQIALTWLLNKVTDKNGNYIKIHYFENNVTGEFRVDKIDYTGNNLAGIAPYNQIKFVYRKRFDHQSVSIAGFPINQSVLLTNIEMFSEGIKAHEYQFNYFSDDKIGSELIEIVEKGSDNKQFNSIKVGWNQSSNMNIPDPNNNSGECALDNVPNHLFLNTKYSGDFNGDGFGDVIVIHTKTPNDPGTAWELYLNDEGLGFNGVSPIYGTMPPGYEHTLIGLRDQSHHLTTVDFNGDGLDDLIVPIVYNNHDEFIMLKSIGSDFIISGSFHPFVSVQSLLSNGNPNPSNGHSHLIGDFDGDGTTDLFVYYYNVDHWFFYFGGSGQELNGSVDWGDEELNFSTLDFDGDGKDEIMFTYNNPSVQPDGIQDYNYILGLVYNNSFALSLQVISHGTFPNSCEGKNNNILPGDFNGDGNMDILTYNYCSNVWLIGYVKKVNNAFSKQYQTFPAPFPTYGDPSFTTADREYFVADFNSDRKSDILIFFHYYSYTSNSYHKFLNVYYSLGNNQFHLETINLNNTDQTDGASLLSDFNGDGLVDLLFSESLSSYGQQLNGIYLLGGGNNGAPAISSNYGKVIYINDGLNKSILIDYATLPELARHGDYSIGNPLAYPVRKIQKAISVVKKYTLDNGIGGRNLLSFQYVGAQFHIRKGFLGFEKRTSINFVNNLKIIDEFQLNYSFFIQLPTKKSSILLSTGQQISEKTSTYLVSQVGGTLGYKIELNNETVNDFTGKNICVDYLYDNNGNLIYKKINENNGYFIEETNNSFIQQCAWIPSLIENSTITCIRLTEPPISRIYHFAYDNNCNLKDEYKDFGLSKEVHTQYFYSGVGQVINKKISAAGVASNEFVYEYDPYFRFVLKEINNPNTLNQVSEYDYDAKYGVVTSFKSPSGLITKYYYDGFGRKTKTLFPGNITSESIYQWETLSTMQISDPLSIHALVKYSITNTCSGKPTSKTFFDILSRTIESETQGFQSNFYTQKQYDARGNIWSETGRYFQTNPPNFYPSISTNFYDDVDGYNLLKSIAVSDNSTHFSLTTLSYSYSNGSSTVVTNFPDGQSISKTFDPIGKLISVLENNQILTYEYFSDGLMKNSKINNILQNAMTYENPYGFQSSLWRYDAGTTFYTHSSYGQIISETDANGNTYNVQYDVLGKMTSKSGPDGTYLFTYINSGDGLNQIAQSAAPNGNTTTYTYDHLGRLKTYNEIINTETFTTGYSYDNFGNVNTIIYPNGFEITNEFDNKGYLKKKFRTNDGAILWQGDEVNPFGKYSKYTLSNNVQTAISYDNFGHPTNIDAGSEYNMSFNFDLNSGNLISRKDENANLIESFLYDSENRLTNSQVLGQIGFNINYNQDGTIQDKSETGTYSTYSNTHPNTVSIITNLPGSFPPNQQDLAFTPFNKVSKITEGNYILNFSYGADQQRKSTELLQFNNLQYTKYYQPNYEKIVSATSITEVCYINSPTGMCGLFVMENGVGTLYSVYTDYLGSIEKVTDGINTYKQNFDAWGRNRDPINWTYSNISQNPIWLDRGFTGHEHLNEFGLINMNGRLYDPVVGMMISPDILVQSIGSIKNYNSYSYCLNNPLKYTDPSGNVILIDDIIVGACVSAIFNLYSESSAGNITNFGSFASAIALGGAYGAIAAGVGSIVRNSIEFGGFAAGFVVNSSAAFAGGFTGGATNALLNGANFGNGLVSGLSIGFKAGMIAGLISGVTEGIASGLKGLNFFDGSPNLSDKLEKMYELECVGLEAEFGVGGVDRVILGNSKNLKNLKGTIAWNQGGDIHFIQADGTTEVANGLTAVGNFNGSTPDGYVKMNNNIIYLSKNTVRKLWDGIQAGRQTLYHEWFHANDYSTGYGGYLSSKYWEKAYIYMELRAHIYIFEKFGDAQQLQNIDWYFKKLIK